MSFPWLQVTSPRPADPGTGPDRYVQAASAELVSRAGVLFRLGFSQADAARRLADAVAWEYDTGHKHAGFRRPAALSDQAIAKLVAETYARRPG
jgi:hypothetical protein